MEKIEWNDELELGIADIDSQHRQIIATSNKLIDAIQANYREEIETLLQELKSITRVHFDFEENYLKYINSHLLVEQHYEHRKFEATLNMLYDKYCKEHTNAQVRMIDFLIGWLVDHIVCYDKKFLTKYR